ncbi:MAG: hypothetical protein JNK48_07690 [Bryobacterales bacterium]|nr:hypothetical protein [Bryobacterales bacterium]
MKIARRVWLASVLGVSCGGGPGEPEQSRLAAIAASGEFQFPRSAVLLFEDRNAGSLGLWVVRSDEGYTMPGEKLMVDPAAVRTELEKHVKIADIGELMDPMAERWSWENAAGRWRAASIRGAGGYFLHLEQFAKT